MLAENWAKTALQNNALAIAHNSKYYQDQTLEFETGDLVITFTEQRGDPTPHRKLSHFSSWVWLANTIALIGTITSQGATTQWKSKHLVIHWTKLHYYQSRETPGPTKTLDIYPPSITKSLIFSNVALVHVEKLGSDWLGLRAVDLLTPAPSRKPLRAP